MHPSADNRSETGTTAPIKQTGCSEAKLSLLLQLVERREIILHRNTGIIESDFARFLAPTDSLESR